jgi:hypothetical protein
MTNSSSYRVGYKKPPERTRFKKGKSGNPGGRPRGTKSFISLLVKALDERVLIVEGGQRTKITKLEALAKQFANKGAAGDLKAATLLLDLLRQVEDHKNAEQMGHRNHGQGISARELLAERIKKISEAMTEASSNVSEQDPQ